MKLLAFAILSTVTVYLLPGMFCKKHANPCINCCYEPYPPGMLCKLQMKCLDHKTNELLFVGHAKKVSDW